MADQNFSNHAKYVPGFHFVTFGILTLNLIWRILYAWRLWGKFGHTAELSTLADIGVAVALVLLAWYLRAFPLRVQDRIIRAEERERLGRLLPAELRARIAELQPRQLVALRFASDDEVAVLVAKVLDQRIDDPKAIKQMIRSWRADHLRA
jgi:hypothetical protein